VPWSIADAKNQFSEVVRCAVQQGPQTISVRGEETAVLLSKADYDRLRDPQRPKDFKEWLLNGPSLEELDLERDQSPPRDIEI
jgi:antitoxin Phd